MTDTSDPNEFDDATPSDEYERSELTPRELFDILHPRDEHGRFIPRELDLSPDDIAYFDTLGETE